MKKITCIFLSILLLFSISACGQQPSGQNQPTTPEETSPSPDQAEHPSEQTELTHEQTTQPETSPDTSTEGGTLVVYFSATGSTEAVAQTIAEHLGADIFELVPSETYTSDDLNWTDDGSRVNLEHEDESLRNVELVSTTPENWDGYDTVFVGYPIWWGIAAWPVNHFVADNDFAGKTVIPFCTSTSSGLGESGELLAEMAGTGDWQEGQRFSSSVDAADVTDWVDGLELR